MSIVVSEEPAARGLEEKISFDLFPNPANELVTLELDAYLGREVDIRMYNVMGALVWYQRDRKVELPQFQIELGRLNLANGEYTIVVLENDRPVVRQLRVYGQ